MKNTENPSIKNQADGRGNSSNKSNSLVKKLINFFKGKGKKQKRIPTAWETKVRERTLKTIEAKKDWDKQRIQPKEIESITKNLSDRSSDNMTVLENQSIESLKKDFEKEKPDHLN